MGPEERRGKSDANCNLSRYIWYKGASGEPCSQLEEGNMCTK